MKKDKYETLQGLTNQRMSLIIAKKQIEKSLTSDKWEDIMRIKLTTNKEYNTCVIESDDILNKLKDIISEEIKDTEEFIDNIFKVED